MSLTKWCVDVASLDSQALQVCGGPPDLYTWGFFIQSCLSLFAVISSIVILQKEGQTEMGICWALFPFEFHEFFTQYTF